MTESIARTAATQTQVLALELGLTESAQKEIIQKHLVAMLAMERRDKWQLIETAPDTGVFIVWCGFACFGYIGYHHGEKRWYDADAMEGGNILRVHPTHWQPLPSPPGASE